MATWDQYNSLLIELYIRRSPGWTEGNGEKDGRVTAKGGRYDSLWWAVYMRNTYLHSVDIDAKTSARFPTDLKAAQYSESLECAASALANVGVSAFSFPVMPVIVKTPGIKVNIGPLGYLTSSKSVCFCPWRTCKKYLGYGEGQDFIVQKCFIFIVGRETSQHLNFLLVHTGTVD